jgi:hypothetical protein
MGVADFTGQPAVFIPNKWPISPKYPARELGQMHKRGKRRDPIPLPERDEFWSFFEAKYILKTVF